MSDVRDRFEKRSGGVGEHRNSACNIAESNSDVVMKTKTEEHRQSADLGAVTPWLVQRLAASFKGFTEDVGILGLWFSAPDPR